MEALLHCDLETFMLTVGSPFSCPSHLYSLRWGQLLGWGLAGTVSFWTQRKV